MVRIAMADIDTRQRVKVYSFNDKMQWEDMGTGHVSVNYVERLQSLIILVRSEEDGKLLALGACRLACNVVRRGCCVFTKYCVVCV